MHDFKLEHYDHYFLSNDLILNILKFGLYFIPITLLLIIIVLIIFRCFSITETKTNIIMTIIIVIIMSLFLSIMCTHLDLKDAKYNLQYGAKAQVIEYKTYQNDQKNNIADDRQKQKVQKSDYMIVKMKDKKQKFYLDKNVKNNDRNKYRVVVKDHFKKGDKVKIILHVENNLTVNFNPHVGQTEYLDLFKSRDVNKNYIEFKKIKC